MMAISTTDITTAPLLTLSGRFDAFETDGFRSTFDALLEELRTGADSSVSVDLHDVHFIDSSGLAELVRAMKHCRERGGELLLRRLSDAVQVILELTRLDAAFEIVGDER